MKKNFLPISIDIADEKILLIGGGQSALSKLKILQRFNANVEVLALEIINEIKDLNISYREEAYKKEYLKGYLMLYSCTNNPELDRKIALDAKAEGVLVNIHDNPELCQFVSPAIHKMDNIRIAVSSNAQDVYASIRIRNEIKDFYNRQPQLKEK